MAKKQAPDIEVLAEPPSTDQQLVTTEGDKLRSFLGGLSAFFKRAGELERAAKDRLDRARQLKPPTNAASDEKIQLFIRESKDEIKVAEDHWTIAGTLHHLHRTITTARGRTTGKDSKGNPTGMLEQAAQIAQNHHNRFVEDENRRAREEQTRLNREAEDRAQRERERDLVRLEAEAVTAESGSTDLSEREQTFVDGVIRLGLSSTQAAAQAGFRNPARAAERLNSWPKIVAALDAKTRAVVLREQATATRHMPVQHETTIVRPNISRAAGVHDRTTYGAEVFDANALLVAVLDPMSRTRLGIPMDVVMINPSKVNEYGNAMKELIDQWPGVRHTKKTTTV